MATEGDLSDFDIHLIMEALSTRQSKVVASCALNIKLLLTEIQQQLLDLMVDGRLADTPVSHLSEDAAEEDSAEFADYYVESLQENAPNSFAQEQQEELDTTEDPVVVTGAVIPITGSLIKSPNPYPCPDCSLVFSTKKALSRHVAKHNKDGDVSGLLDSIQHVETPTDNAEGAAKQAEPMIVQSDALETAVQEPIRIKLSLPKSSPAKPRSSQSGVRLTCEICGIQTLKQHMARHMLTHSDVKPFPCSKCASAFSRKDKLKEHLKKHEDGTDSLIKMPKKTPRSKLSKCRKCEFETEDKDLLKEHRKTHPTKMVYKCEDCDKEFHCPSHLEQHSIKHRNEKPFMCDMCGVSFSREPNLARHIRSHTSPAPYNCKFCNKPYHRNNELIVHERTHTGEKPYICEICGNGYASSKYLKRHLFTHTGLKPFKCDLCERAFARPENMRAHRKLHEKPTNRLPPPTRDAMSAFRTSHIDPADEAIVVDGMSSPQHSVADMYPFPNADIPTSVSNDAVTAAASHSVGDSVLRTAAKSYKCDLCESAFERLDSLRTHLKLHEKAITITRLLPPTNAVASAFRSNRIDSAVVDDVDNISSPQHSVAEMYPFAGAAAIPSSVSNNNAAAASNPAGESIMQSFKIDDEL